MRAGARIASLRSAILAAILIAASSCKPDLGAPISLIQGPRILAVRGTPPEAKEGAGIIYDLLAVDISAGVPEATIPPPASPAPGPISMM